MNRAAVKKLGGYGVAAVVLAAAIAVNLHLPDDRFTQAAFTVHGGVGDHLVGRNVAVTVHGVQVADVLRTFTSDGYTDRTTAGKWVAVDATLDTVVSPGPINGVKLVVPGGATYAATKRGTDGSTMLRDSPKNPGLHDVETAPGLPRRGLYAFEVAADVAGLSDVQLQLALTADERLDSQLIVDLNLASAQRIPRVDLTEATHDR